MSLKVAGIPKRILLENGIIQQRSFVTVDDVQSLWEFRKKEKISVKLYISWLCKLTGLSPKKIHEKSLISKLHRESKTLRTLRGQKLLSAREQVFNVPVHSKTVPMECQEVPLQANIRADEASSQIEEPVPSTSNDNNQCIFSSSARAKSGNCSKGPSVKNSKTTEFDRAVYKSVAFQLAGEVKTLSVQVEQTEGTLAERREKVASLNEQKKQLKRKQMSLKNKVEKTKEEVSLWKREAKKMKKEVQKPTQLIKALQAKKLRLDKANQANLKLKKLLIKSQQDLKMAQMANMSLSHENTKLKAKCEELHEIALESEKLKTEYAELETNCQYLEGLLQDNMVIQLFDEGKGRYTAETVQCVMNLTSSGVSSRNVGPVIRDVLHLHGKTGNRLPSKSAVEEMCDSKVAIAQKQLKKVIKKESSLCLMSDETSKRGVKSNVFIVSDEERNSYMLGLREMASKSASTVLDTFKEVLDDIAKTCSSMERTAVESSNVGFQILGQIRDTMSDRAASEKLFHQLLEDYRGGLLPTIITEWNDMDEATREALSKFHNFYCALHLLVGIADVTCANIGKFERLSQDSSNAGDKEWQSGSVNLVRMVTKAFSRGGDEKSGCFLQWKTYLDSENEKTHFFRFRGNRFNVVFVLGKLVFYHHKRILTFLKDVNGATNQLLQAILRDIQNEICIEACRVLGLLSDLVTAPFWRLVESCTHVLGLNEHYKAMHDFLKKAADNPSDFLSGKSPFSNDVVFIENPVSKYLLDGAEGNALANQIAKGVCLGLVGLLERMVADQLPGGKYHDITEKLVQETKSVIPHNKQPEFAFGILDRLISFRPNATTLANEAYIMFSFNKTGEWLEALPKEEREKYINESRKEGKQMRRQFQIRSKQIKAEQLKMLQAKKDEIQRKEAKRLQGEQCLTQDIVFYGLWQREDDMNLALEELRSQNDKRKALIAQLKFRKGVLKQQFSDSSVFNQSTTSNGKRRNLTTEEMKRNLLKLIEAASLGVTSESGEGTPDKPLLVGKSVAHKFDDGVEYKGRVISVVPGFPQWYNIVYQGDQAVYTYKLMDDYAAGDLQIIPGALDDSDNFVAP